MNARDVMTSQVVSVGPDTPTHEVAKVLREHGISAIPVVNRDGAPIGMVSEGDLIGRDQADREARRDWWLNLLAEGEILNAEFLAALRASERRARNIMAAPVVTVAEDTDIGEIARLLTAYRIKRVPVLRDGRIVGIVSRADLVRALAAEQMQPTGEGGGGRMLAEAVAGIERRFLHRQQAVRPAQVPSEPAEGELMAADFRRLAADHEHQEAEHLQEDRRTAAEQRRRKVAELIDHHLSDEHWRALMQRARHAAEHGGREFMLLRFPSQICTDGGRAVNVADPDWPATLRGEAAEIYLRWEHDLKQHGFRLAARVLDFPGGMPGDIGVFLNWGQ
jgi:CBS domain-containing protein